MQLNVLAKPLFSHAHISVYQTIRDYLYSYITLLYRRDTELFRFRSIQGNRFDCASPRSFKPINYMFWILCVSREIDSIYLSSTGKGKKRFDYTQRRVCTGSKSRNSVRRIASDGYSNGGRSQAVIYVSLRTRNERRERDRYK